MPLNKKGTAAKDKKAALPPKKTKGKKAEEKPEHSVSENATQERIPHGDDSNINESKGGLDLSSNDSFYDSDTYDEFYHYTLAILDKLQQEFHKDPSDAETPEEMHYINLQLIAETGILEMPGGYKSIKKEMKKMTKHTQNKIRVTLFKILPNTNDTQKNMYNIYICPNLQNSKMEEITKIHYENSKLKLSIMKPSQNLTLKHSKCQISLQFNTISVKPWQTVATKHVKWTHITSTFSIEVVKRWEI